VVIRGCTVVVVLLALVVAMPARAQTQASHEPADPSAQAWFERGLELSGGERWLEARDAFVRSAALAPRPSTYFNLALASLELGLGSAALEALSRFDELADAAQRASYGPQLASLRERAKALLGTVVLSLQPSAARVQVDGQSKPGEGSERVLLLAPGKHVLRIEADGHAPTTLELAVVAQSSVHQHVELQLVSKAQVDLSLPPAATTAPSTQGTTASQPRSRSFWSEPLVWIVAGAAVIGAGVAVGVVAFGSEDVSRTPYTGTSKQVLDPSQ
jgi:hypothetical protein